MKKFLLLSFATCFGLLASAQKVYFLYLQTEDFSPFYVRIGDKIYSSATSGYLIVPNLTDTTYYLNLGFAKSTEPETKFSVAVNKSDRGFLIKKLEDGLSLFDFEELSMVKSNAAQNDNTVYETKTDNFSNTLSKAAGDPSIVRVPVAKKEEEKPEPEKKEETVVKVEEKPTENLPTQDSSTAQTEPPKETKSVVDTTVVKKEENLDTVAKQPAAPETTTVQQTQIEKKEESTAPESPYKPSVISRHSESSTTEGFGVIYFDKDGESTDTIRVLIPASKIKVTAEADTDTVANTQTTTNNADTSAQITKNITNPKTTETPAPASPAAAEKNMSCKATASDKDFLKLRKRMAAEDTDEAMVNEARKDFRTRCYTVEQIRYLSTLFLTSAAKYQFFDAAYEHVTDKTGFASLGAEIKDEYYAKRFKALIGE